MGGLQSLAGDLCAPIVTCLSPFAYSIPSDVAAATVQTGWRRRGRVHPGDTPSGNLRRSVAGDVGHARESGTNANTEDGTGSSRQCLRAFGLAYEILWNSGRSARSSTRTFPCGGTQARRRGLPGAQRLSFTPIKPHAGTASHAIVQGAVLGFEVNAPEGAAEVMYDLYRELAVRPGRSFQSRRSREPAALSARGGSA